MDIHGRTPRAARRGHAGIRVLGASLLVAVAASVVAVVPAASRSASAAGTVPAVTAVSPASGPMAGGTTVTVTGTALTGTTKVLFGTVRAAAVTVDSDTQVTVVSPSAPAGTVHIRVTTPAGTSPMVAADRFTFVPPPPAVTGVSPASGVATGGTTVTVTGTHLTGATRVAFGTVVATPVTVVSDTQLTVVSPAEAPGRKDVRVTTRGGTSPVVVADRFTVWPAGYPFCGTGTGTPTTTKLLVIYEENHSAGAIYGSAAAPNINGYAAACGRATNYHALTHPSLPNYLQSTSGVSYASAPWNVDCIPTGSCITPNENIFDQVGPSGWRSYAESMPANCSTATTASYVPRHNPAVYYSDLAASCGTDDVPLGTPTDGALAADVAAGTLPTFGTVTPDLTDDMHDASVAQGDAWLATWIPTITAGPDYRSGDLAVVIVWDEGAGTGNVPSTVAMIVLSPFVTPGTTSTVYATHDSLLKAAEGIAGVRELGGAASASDLRAAFGF
jgi:phosphatidylinositol-3-phosphatase